MRPTVLLALSLLSFAAAVASVRAADPLAAPVAEVRTLLRSGDVDRAAEAAERAVAALADDAQAWWWAGRAYGTKAMRSGLLGKARWAGRTREAFEKAVALDPTHLDARLDLLDYYRMAPGFMGGGEDKAQAQAAAIAAQDASLGKYAAAVLQFGDDAARGEALLREALALDAGNQRARHALASVATTRKDWSAARELWEAQLALESGGADDRAGPEADGVAGNAAAAPVDDAHADRIAGAHYQLGKLAALSGESLDSGLSHIDRFIANGRPTEDLSLPAAYWRRGQILGHLGRRDEAIASLERALPDEQVREQAEADLARIRGQ